MKFRIQIAVSFCEIIMLLLVCLLAAFATNLISLEVINKVVSIAYIDPDIRILVGLAAVLLLLLTHMMGKSIRNLHQRERNIAFDNPAGRVHVTLSALEDLVRRTLFELDEIKDARVFVRVKKGGVLEVQALKLVLNGDYNIPETIAQIQKVIQKKIEGTIGAEQKTIIDVNVTKMVSQEKKKKKKVASEAVDEGHNVPFQGYRA